jgi:hypothetical protein
MGGAAANGARETFGIKSRFVALSPQTIHSSELVSMSLFWRIILSQNADINFIIAIIDIEYPIDYL